ncbi:MAG: YggS family pyridoxal phosphate-dependent enzyme [Clostridia bacterium]|nr:YggS family pyridoxal phosphate-dependent enzyme [Clostridia bacterium]
MSDYGYIRRNFDALSQELGELGERAGHAVTLVAVTKSGTDEELLALAECGIGDIGENRPQELVRRAELLRSHGYAPRLHEIGNLQRNKVKSIITVADLTHSVGKLSLAEAISREAAAAGITARILIEINSAKEENKGGVYPELAEEFFLRVKELPSLAVCGLMTMGPPTEDGELLRPYFRQTKKIFDTINEKYGFHSGGILSMGMSDSYAVAIEEGSTLVRVGRRFFWKEG